MSTDASTEDLTGIAGWVVDVIDKVGPLGVGALIALENVVPPIPSEVILPFAGFAASRGDINVVAAWVAATIGAIVGAWVLYGIGALIGRERLESLTTKKWFFFVSASDLTRGEKFFERHGPKIVLIGRCIPLVRSVVSVPAGLDRMPLAQFTLLTAIGSGVWNAVFIAAGNAAGDNWEDIEGIISPISYAVVGLLFLALVYLIVRRFRSSDPTDPSESVEVG